MKRHVILACCVLSALPLLGQAEHAYINLQVFRIDPDTGKTLAREEARADQEPPLGGVAARPLFKVKVNEPLVLQFFLTNAYPHGVTKNVTVHYFVVPEAKARQKELPKLSDNVVTQGEFTLNFKPKCRVGARVAFTVRNPGFYLLRVHTRNTTSDHEHFSAIDLQAE